MNIVADENVDRQVVDHLLAKGHHVLYVAELDPGIDDNAVLLKARELDAILPTTDKDFGELVFRQHLHHAGVMFIRLAGLTSERRVEAVASAFDAHNEELPGRFSVVPRNAVRLREAPRAKQI